MKFIKGLLLITVFGLLLISCKETKKDEINEVDDTTVIEGNSNTEENATTTKPSGSSTKKVNSAEGSKEPAKEIDTKTEGTEKLVESTVISANLAEYPPIFPECEGSIDELKACLQKGVVKFVMKNFDSDLANELALKEGEHIIRVQFDVDVLGKIANVIAQAPDKELEREAIRVIELLPEMVPAKNGGSPVGVTYLLPINFDVQHD